MDALHEDIFRDIDNDGEVDLCNEEPESSCTNPRRKCARCQELGRRCRRCRNHCSKSSLELALGSKTSQRQASIEEMPSEPTRTIRDTPTRTRPEEAAHGTSPIYSERTYNSHTTYHSEYDSSSNSTSRSDCRRASRRRRRSYTRSRSRHRSYRYAEEIRGPTYHRSDVQFEVIKTSIGWKLLSTKCHVEKFESCHSTHYHEHRHFAEPSTDHLHCRTCRWFPTEDIVFENVRVTYIKKAPHRGYAEEVWSAMIGEPLPMRGSVIRSTWRHSGPLRVRRDRISGPGRLMDCVFDPSDCNLSLEDIVNYLYEVGKSVYYALRYRIFGIYPAGDKSHDLD
ncbi:hypothetical protein FSST1_011984 [Fusarium sambucinum]